MAFLFKSKKHQSSGFQPQAKDVPAVGPHVSQALNPTNGVPAPVREKDREVLHTQSPTPNSTAKDPQGGDATPSPEQKSVREETDMKFQGPRNAPSAPPPSTSANASLYPWSQRRFTFTTNHPIPFPRYGAAVNSITSKEGDIYLMGGLINGSTVKGDLWMAEAGGSNLACYPLATTSEGPGPRVGHASLIVGNAFIVYGGDTKMDDRDMLDDTLYLLNTSTRHWSRAIPAGPRPSGRYGHTLNIIGSKIYIFGGQVEGYFFNDLVAFDLNALQEASNRWEMLILNSNDGGPPPGQVPPARTNHTVVSWNEKLYLFGGTNGVQWFNDVWTYDPRSNAWSQLDCIGYIPAPREGHAATLVGDVMYIFGGRTEEASDLGDLAAFRISSRRWYTFQNMGPSPSPRSGHSMTSYGKQIFVLGGEPSSAPRDVAELSMAYVLDTAKIRYPNDQSAAPLSSSTERTPGGRRPSGSERSGIPQSRAPGSRDGSTPPVDPRESKRIMAAPRESVVGTANPFGKPPDPVTTNGISAGPGTGSRLPRVSMAQAPLGPPPQQQAPTPRPNGVLPTPPAPRSKTPTRGDRGYQPSVDTTRGPSLEKEGISPATRDSPSSREPPSTAGRRTPTQQAQSKIATKTREIPEAAVAGTRERSRSRQARQQTSVDSTTEPQKQVLDRGEQSGSTTPVQRSNSSGAKSGLLARQQNEFLVKELEATKSRLAWYASEMALARKSGYTPNPMNGNLDDRTPDSFGDEDRPLVEALLVMRDELERVQSSIDAQTSHTAKQIAEVERQRDVAVSEAVYAKAKLAAHGGSQRSTPQPDGSARDLDGLDSDRAAELSRKLAASLNLQHELQARLDAVTAEMVAEKQARKLAEETANAAQARVSELDSNQQRNASEVEGLRAALHHAEKLARDEAAQRTEAVASYKLLRVDKEDLQRRLEQSLGASRDHSTSLGSLQKAVLASADKSNMLETKLMEERAQREAIERKHRQLAAEHEERTVELAHTTKRLRDAEDLAETHATEARTHRQALLSGIAKLPDRSLESPDGEMIDERVKIMQDQVDAANALVKKSRAAADGIAEKLRSAEERIAGLESYQEQASREGLTIRKQLQAAMKDSQTLMAENAEMRSQIANHQLEANAIAVRHGALKDLLGERGINSESRSRTNGSPSSGFNTPEPARVRQLEQQLDASLKAHRETEDAFESRERETERSYNEKLEQLEKDHKEARRYMMGAEEMFKRLNAKLSKRDDELSRSKKDIARLQAELEEAHSGQSRSLAQEAPAQWEQERKSLQSEIEALQGKVKTAVSQLQEQMEQVRGDLSVAREQRDQYQANTEAIEHRLTTLQQQARADLEQLKAENAHLESRALDAEQKVSLLLDQVESSVDNYRRQSRQLVVDVSGPEMNGAGATGNHHGHHRRASSTSAATDSVYSPSGRNSLALDSLANELDALRNHWETTNKNYRLSNNYDADKGPPSAEGNIPWNKRWRDDLDLDESDDDRPEQHHGNGHAQTTDVNATPTRKDELARGGDAASHEDGGEPTPTKADYGPSNGKAESYGAESHDEQHAQQQQRPNVI